MTEFHQTLGIFEVWDFPTLDERADRIECHVAQEEAVIEEDAQLAEANTAMADCMQKVNQHLDLLNAISLGLQRKQTEFDETLLDNMILLIKNTVKKILHKELALDNTVLKNMIQHALDDINKQHEACVVYVSADDYALFGDTSDTRQFDVRCDTTLSCGDFVIKTRLSELEALLEPRLNALFGL